MAAERRTLDPIETMILDWLHGVSILIQTMITERIVAAFAWRTWSRRAFAPRAHVEVLLYAVSARVIS